jgi:hypothetical protein
VHGWAENAATTISSNPLTDRLSIDIEGPIE